MNISGKTRIIKVLLVCGILSSLLYVATDIIAATALYPGYSFTDQMYSELLAIGAPTRPYMIPLSIMYNILVILFGIGILVSSGRNRTLRIVGIMLVVYGVFSGAGPFVPMHMRGSEATLTDTLHKIDTIVISLLTMLCMGFGAAALGKRFRLYSIGTILILLVFGGLAGLQAPRLGAGLPTPWFGLMERMDIYASMLWVAVLAFALLHVQGTVPERSLTDQNIGNVRLKALTAK
jgi:hypothetical protein